MMQHSSGRVEHGYSKITRVNASREIITCFIAHRTSQPEPSCSRPVDFFALLAAMTILLTHINSRHNRQGGANLLAHQRLSDRAILHQALEGMGVMSSSSKDSVAEKSAKLIRQLLEVEEDIAEGSDLSVRNVSEDEIEARGSTKPTRKELRLQVPYLGTIKISRSGYVCRELESPLASHEPHPQRDSTRFETTSVSMLALQTPSMVDQTLTALPSPSASTWSPNDAHLQPSTTSHTDHCDMFMSDTDTSTNTTGQDSMMQQTVMDLPDITCGDYVDDDWVSQGVDTVFFDTLMRGSS